MFRYLQHAIIFTAVSIIPTATKSESWKKLPTIPYALNNKQDAISFVEPKTGWYGNGTGKLYHTRDGGATWSNIWSRPGTYIRSVDFSDASTGYLGNIGADYYPNVTDAQSLYVTHDGGKRWSAIIPTTGPRIKGVCAIDILKVAGKVLAIRAGGRVGGPAGLLESFDEGKTWQSRDMHDVTGMILDIHFVSKDIGFIAGASAAQESEAHARILKTTDAGKTWRTVFESERDGDINWKLSFPNENVGYATIISYQAPENEARGYVMKTTDAGEHWQPLTVTQDRQWVPYGIGFLDESRGWVGGSTGGYETRDGGKTWSSTEMGLSTNRIRFAKGADGNVSAYAIGQDVYKLDIK